MIDDPDDFLSMTLRGTAREVIKISRDLRDVEESVLDSMAHADIGSEHVSELQRFDLADQTLQQIAALLYDLSNDQTRGTIEGISKAIDTLNLGGLAHNLRPGSKPVDNKVPVPPGIDMF